MSVPPLFNSLQHSDVPSPGNVSCCLYDVKKSHNTSFDCSETKLCVQTDIDVTNNPGCYVAAEYSLVKDKFRVVNAGCWFHDNTNMDHNCTSPVIHLATRSTKDHHFGCCSQSLCNGLEFIRPNKSQILWAASTQGPRTTAHYERMTMSNELLVVYAILALVAFCFVVLLVFFFWRKCKLRRSKHGHIEEQQRMIERTAPNLRISELRLGELQRHTLIARGRFGSVWKGELGGGSVAIKIFPLQDEQSWLTEQEMYTLPHMQHDNILRFLGLRRACADSVEELWLVTEYQPLGSLFDHLKANVLSWDHVLKVSESMLAGLAHVHEFIPAQNGTRHKPTIAHRDFKSRNVLLKPDLSACIADFGLALKFEPGSAVGDTLGQVGTRRYMAPEVLDGAISFHLDAFLRIDMYAAAFVLWELLSRCSVVDGPIEAYRLPLEEEVGAHPSLERMQEVVVMQKKRPLVKETWRKHQGVSSLCATIAECWDADADARLSASCVLERVRALSTGQLNRQTVDSLRAHRQQISLSDSGGEEDELLPMQSLNSHAEPDCAPPPYTSRVSAGRSSPAYRTADVSLEAPSVDSAVDVSPVPESSD